MDREVRRLLLVGSVVLILALLVNLPARHVLGWIGLQDSVAMEGVTGTVWSGGAAAASVAAGAPGPQDDFYLGAVRWQFRPSALLVGRFEYAIAAEGGPRLAGLNGNVSPTGGQGVQLIDTTGRARLDAVAPLLAVPMLSGIAGTVEFDLRHVELVRGEQGAGWPRRANGSVVLRNVAIPLLRGSLGDYRIDFRDAADSNDVLVDYRDLDNGPLAIEGTAVLHPDGSLERRCTASVRDGAPAMLRQAVPMLCSEDMF